MVSFRRGKSLLSGLELEVQAEDGDDRHADEADGGGALPAVELDVEVGVGVEVDVGPGAVGEVLVHAFSLLADGPFIRFLSTSIIIWISGDGETVFQKVDLTPIFS